ncbi:efflux transporter, outer membrane factor (OMF) lipoprotein, NodT family [Rhizobiales bacterium GAS191]|nr:efflux transporter, outer membrane factor (OMF) lipoprotein, NodT family [Rhizobiales bacterium GAS191]
MRLAAQGKGAADGRSESRAQRRRDTSLLLLMLSAPLLSGCILVSPKPTLDVEVAKSFREARAAPAPPPSIDWPRDFRSSELTRLAADAQAGNLDIAAAVARIAQADAQATIDSVGLYPTLGGTANAQRSFSPGTTHSKRGPFKTSSSNLFSLGLTASYAVDFWGLNAANARSGRLLAEASRFDRDVVALTTAASVANSYLAILGAQDRLRIANNNTQIADRVLKAIQNKLAVGTGTAIDVSQQESVAGTQRASIPPLVQTVAQSKNLLAVLMGRTPESSSVKGGSLDSLTVPRVPAGIPSQLLLRRPDIAAAEAQLAAANASVYAARAAFFPNIKLSAQGGVESLLLKTLFRSDAVFGQMAAGLTQPIFDGYNLEGQLELQQGRQAELLQTYRKAIIQAFSDVENALIAVEQTTRHERLEADVVTTSRKAYQLTEQKLREGTIDITTVLNTQQTLFQAEDTLSQIRLQRLLAVVSLYQALGGGWTRDRYPVTKDDEAATQPGPVLPSGVVATPGNQP